MPRRRKSKDTFPIKQWLERLRDWRLSILLVACVVLGGTAQSVLTYKLPLYIISLLFIGQVLSFGVREPLSKLTRTPIIISAIFFALFILNLIPLPPSIWTHFAGRSHIVDGFNAINTELPWLPISLTPEKTLFSLFDFIPIIAVILIMTLSANRGELKKSQFTIIALATFTALLGLLQTLAGPESFRLYENFTPGFGVGVFTNANHQATFLAMALPLALYITAHSEKNIGWHNDIKLSQIFGAFSTIIIIMGIFLSGSSAGYALLLFGFILTLWIINKGSATGKIILGLGIAVCALILIDIFFLSGQFQEVLKQVSIDTQTSRSAILETSLQARKDFGVLGTGPGSFADVYKLYEDHSQITKLYINEAHNDYLQIWFEMGWAGVLTVLAGLGWLMLQTVVAFKTSGRRRRKALIFIVITLIALLHATVDYSFRTIAISALFIYFVLRIDTLCRDLNHSA